MIAAAFITGFAGSLHCVGMCGPIALALRGGAGFSFWIGRILYQFGRICTYALLGAIAGFAGYGAGFFHVQQIFSIVVGIVMLLLALKEWGLLPFLRKSTSAGLLPAGVRRYFSSLLTRGTPASLWMTGVLNGFLPCGLVYLGLASAAMTLEPVNGALAMMAFGAGTFPAMMAVSVMPSFFPKFTAKFSSRVAPVLLSCMAVLLILRGMALGIPYISPKMEMKEGKTVISCCDTATLKGK